MQPLAHQLTGGISLKLTDLFALHMDGVYNRTKGDYKQLDINARNPPGTNRACNLQRAPIATARLYPSWVRPLQMSVEHASRSMEAA